MRIIIKIQLTILCISLLTAGISCKSKHVNKFERSFYYWKTSYDFDKNDMNFADTIGLQRMYIKCFDIDWSENASKAIPVGMLSASYYMDLPFQSVTPCVFITNTVMEKCSNDDLKELAENISEKLTEVFSNFSRSYSRTTTEKLHDSVNVICSKYSEPIKNEILRRIDWSEKAREEKWLLASKEIQIDCDWTEKTKKKYFYFLKQLKELLPDKSISCTLRLWQYSNRKKAGIPPVDRCMLMCYSVGSPKNYDGKNSISNAEDIKAYLKKGKYSLPLDIALPVFSWGLLFRNGHFKGILHNTDLQKIEKDTTHFEHQEGNLYKYLTDTVIENTYIRYGDEVKFETVDSTELVKIIDIINTKLDLPDKTRIAFFSWDTTYIKQYGTKNFEKYYNSFQ